MPQITEAEVFRACRTLFGSELNLSRDFLHYLQPAGVRSAYRKKAKATHPDRFAVAATATQEKQQRLFQDLNQAHQTVLSYLRQRERLPVSSILRSRSANYSQPQRRRQDRPHSKYYRGPLPNRPLQFGLYLYYLGIVPFNAVISAITWQRKQRPVVGEIAKRWGWLNDEQVRQILNYRGAGVHKFGERAEQMGLLKPLQVGALLMHQRSQQRQMGDYFIEQGFFAEEQLNQLLNQLAEHNRTFRQGYGGHYYFYHR